MGSYTQELVLANTGPTLEVMSSMPSVRVRMASKQVSTPACTSASEGSYTILLSLTTSLMPNKGVCTSVDWSAFHRACTNTVQDGSWNADRWASTQSCPVNQCLHELLVKLLLARHRLL